VVISLFVFLFVCRLLSNTLTAVGSNPLLDFVSDGEKVSVGKKIAALLVILVFEAAPSGLMMIAVIVLQLNEDKLVARMNQMLERSDLTIVDYYR
jgi:enhancing lycopene biosynthesis protein 2